MRRESFIKNAKGEKRMSAAMEEMKKEVEERTLLKAIKNIMESLHYTAPQAMELLKIPPSEQPIYLSKL